MVYLGCTKDSCILPLSAFQRKYRGSHLEYILEFSGAFDMTGSMENTVFMNEPMVIMILIIITALTCIPAMV